MDLKIAQTTTIAKFPILKQGDMWRLRIEQYIQVQDYALWDVIENGNSFILAAQTTTNADGTSTKLIPGPVATEEKVQKNDVKTRNLNLNFLRSLPYEWNTHVVVWRNKPNLDTMSIDDLYNNFKIVEQEVKRTTSSSLSSQNMDFVSSPSSTNEVNTAYGVNTANTQVSPAHTQVSTSSTQRYMVDDEVPTNMALMAFLDSEGNPQLELQEKGVIDSGYSRHMTGNMSYLLEYEEIDGGYVAFGGDPKGGKITGGLTCLFAKATLDESNL
nr:hypothetical protein [Tanacetum cinerariifolium]